MITLVLLVFGWVALWCIAHVADPNKGRLSPRSGSFVLLIDLVALVALPFAALMTELSRGLSILGPGSALARCGRLIAALIRDPGARPDVTVAALGLVLLVVGCASGAIIAMRSQRCVSRLCRRTHSALIIAASDERFAYTAGLLKPRIVLSRGLLTTTPSGWLDVVLAHESAHRRGRHPLMLFVAEALSRGLPFWPLAAVARRLRLSLEMAADESAARMFGTSIVAEAISGLALRQPINAIGFDGDTVARVRRLLAQRPTSFRSSGAIVAATIVLAIFGLGHAAHCSLTSLSSLRMKACPLRSTGQKEMMTNASLSHRAASAQHEAD